MTYVDLIIHSFFFSISLFVVHMRWYQKVPGLLLL
jgi:hypothetical protein